MRKIIFKICFLVIIWSVIIILGMGLSVLFNLINLGFLNSLPPEVIPDPITDPNIINIMAFVLPLCFGLALSMRLFEKELMKKGDEK